MVDMEIQEGAFQPPKTAQEYIDRLLGMGHLSYEVVKPLLKWARENIETNRQLFIDYHLCRAVMADEGGHPEAIVREHLLLAGIAEETTQEGFLAWREEQRRLPR